MQSQVNLKREAGSYPDILQEDSSSPLVLQFHQLLCVFALLVRLVAEKLGKVVQRLVIPVEVVGLWCNRALAN